MALRDRIRLPDSPALARLCRANHVTGLWLFGSVLRADFRPDSDVDVLVEFDPAALVGFIEVARLHQELVATFGRAVDLVPAAGLEPAPLAGSIVLLGGHAPVGSLAPWSSRVSPGHRAHGTTLVGA